MYKQDLEKLISSNLLPKFLLLYGQCEYLSNKYISKIANIFWYKRRYI